jgi:SAM-dependent methyltransferase
MAEFDRFGDTYEEQLEAAISFARQDADFFVDAKARVILQLIRAQLGDPATVRALDVGAGIGTIDGYLEPHLGSLDGTDVSEAMLKRAAAANPRVSYKLYDGTKLPFADSSFDFVFTICVVHHVPRSSWPRFVSELSRVIRPGGLVLLVEHNPLNPLTRLVVNRCAFDEDAVLLWSRTARRLLHASGLEIAYKKYFLFFPWRHHALERIERGVGWLPLGAQYLIAGRRRQGVESIH